MKELLIDTNVLLDLFLPARDPSGAAVELYQLGRNGAFSLCLSSLSVANISYILRKQLGAEAAKPHISRLLQDCKILPVDEHLLSEALRSRASDYEDALLVASADQEGCDCIISDSPERFDGLSGIAVLSPSELLDKICEI